MSKADAAKPAVVNGIIKIEMHFLADVYVPCEVCKGKRYNRETLEVKYKDKSIYDVLNMTVEEALAFFENIPSIKRKIQTLYDVGLSYIRLGQPSTNFRVEKRRESSLRLNSANAVPVVPFIFWMSRRQDFTLRMFISLLRSCSA